MRLRQPLSFALPFACVAIFRISAVSLPSDEQKPSIVIKSQTTLVQVPTVVTDKDGKHVHGLTRNDFHVFENGAEQKIGVFEEVAAGSSRAAAPNNLPNTFTNLSQGNALTVVLLDAINTTFNDQRSGREALLKYVAEHRDAHQPMALMVMNDRGVRRISGATDDASSVIAALRNLKSEAPATEGFSIDPDKFSAKPQHLDLTAEAARAEANAMQNQAIDHTLRAFLAIAWSMTGVPGRKTLIWATGSFPFYLDSTSPQPDDPHLVLLYERTMEALNDAQIAVYPVDVRGLGSNTHIKEDHEENQLEKLRARNQIQESTLHNLGMFADMTGGRAFYNRNDLDTGFGRAVDDSSSYYLVGYYKSFQNAKPGWRRLEVKLPQKEMEVRARDGFFVGHTTLNPESTQQSDETFALTSPFDSTGVPLLVRLNPPPAENPGHGVSPEFAMIVPANNVVEAADQHRVNVDFIWEASRNGASVLKDGHSLKGAVNLESLEKLRRDGVFYKNVLHLPPGEYQVKFVVRNNLNGQVGSVTAPLTVQ